MHTGGAMPEQPNKTWSLALHALTTRSHTIAWLKANGGYCDCEVVTNAADHWEQNR